MLVGEAGSARVAHGDRYTSAQSATQAPLGTHLIMADGGAYVTTTCKRVGLSARVRIDVQRGNSSAEDGSLYCSVLFVWTHAFTVMYIVAARQTEVTLFCGRLSKHEG